MNGKAIQVTILSLKPGFEDMLIHELAPLTRASRLIAGIPRAGSAMRCTVPGFSTPISERSRTHPHEAIAPSPPRKPKLKSGNTSQRCITRNEDTYAFENTR
jgi:hypothetical protein